jgi:SAM-dependent methyltransferase
VEIKQCRLCQSADVAPAVDLGFHPLADTFLPAELQRGAEVSYPLELGLCGNCGHVFTLFAVSPEDRYQKQDYSYDSSNSRVSIEHFKDYCDAVLADRAVSADALIADIGSNVGTLLSHFQAAGHANVLGIEPSSNISEIARRAGVPTLTEFFDAKAAVQIAARGKVEVLLSSNVVNHADDLPGLLATARQVLSDTGRFVFEVPYLLDLVERTAFDTIYHEHVHYYGIRPLAACLAREGYSIQRVERLDYMCGSIRVYAQRGGAHGPVVAEMIAAEDARQLYAPATYAAFMDRVRAVKLATSEHLWKIRAEGGRIIGIGAATKGNTFLNYCRIDADLVFAIADASRLKIGKRTPGSHIPIIADEDIASTGATHALILPWNIAGFLKKKLAHLGLEFYVPQVETL